ncbi:anthranilate synthase component I, partial [Candidatus Sumerlaeota bacterium]|nr:anthranilate synthase component I [Candidatus Sumerlaeota bacterium]
MKIQPDLKTFREKCREGNLVPVWGEILADLETPVSAFKKLDDGEYAFLLESVEHGERIGRYSFIGCNPTVLIRSRASEVAVLRPGGEEELHDCPNGMEFLR